MVTRVAWLMGLGPAEVKEIMVVVMVIVEEVPHVEFGSLLNSVWEQEEERVALRRGTA